MWCRGARPRCWSLDGPYTITRNPIYIGLILVYFGLAIVMTSLWVLLLLIPVLMILQRGVVLPEEAYLERKFGDAYRKYKARVPRWLDGGHARDRRLPAPQHEASP